MKTVILVLVIVVAMSGCATPPLAKNMIPPIDSSIFISSNKTLKVAEVTGGEKTNPMDLPKIENEIFREALINTLEKSGIFKRIFTDQNGDYELYAEIISQKTLGAFAITSTLFVNYRLVETQNNQEVWKENIFSQYEAKFDVAFYGQTRLKLAQEGVVQDNLTQLSKKLSDVLNKINKKAELPKDKT